LKNLLFIKITKLHLKSINSLLGGDHKTFAKNRKMTLSFVRTASTPLAYPCGHTVIFEKS